jgi:hypothetical protein
MFSFNHLINLMIEFWNQEIKIQFQRVINKIFIIKNTCLEKRLRFYSLLPWDKRLNQNYLFLSCVYASGGFNDTVMTEEWGHYGPDDRHH